MNDKPGPEFKIRLDDHPGDSERVKPDTKSLKDIESQRVLKPEPSASRLPFILIGIVAVLLIAAYLDMRSRVVSVHSSGTKEAQTLSEDLESKFSSLSIKVSSVEATIAKLTETQTATDKSVSALKDDLSKAVSTLKSAKVDKTTLKESLDKIEKRLSPLPEEMKNVMAATNAMSVKLTTGITELNTATTKVSSDLKVIQTAFEALQTEKASKKDLLAEIDHLENVLKTNQERSEKQSAEFSQTLRRLELKIASLEAKAGIAASSSSARPAPAKAPDAAAAPPASTPEPSVPSEDMIEGDLTQ